VGPALLVIGLVASLVGSVMVLWRAFRESVLWGLGCIFVPFVYIIFVIKHWDDTKKGFLIGVSGSVLVLAAAVLTPPIPKQVPETVQEQASMVPATTTHATIEQVTAHAPEPVSAPVTQTEEPVQPVFAQVWADNRTRVYYPRDCASRPESAYLLAKSAADRQGFKPVQCK
jgi:hypothetical protein